MRETVLVTLRRRSTLQFHPDLEEPCCLFPGRGIKGYGQIRRGGVTRKAHLWSALIFGKVHPPTQEWDHLCRNRNCWEPTHLEAVIRRVNIARGINPGARASREDICINGHKYTQENTYMYMWAGKENRRCIACNTERMRRYRAKRSPTTQTTPLTNHKGK